MSPPSPSPPLARALLPFGPDMGREARMIGRTRGSRCPRAWRPRAPPPTPESTRVGNSRRRRSTGYESLTATPGIYAAGVREPSDANPGSCGCRRARASTQLAVADRDLRASASRCRSAGRSDDRGRRRRVAVAEPGAACLSLPRTITGNVTSRAISERIARRRPPASVVRLLAGVGPRRAAYPQRLGRFVRMRTRRSGALL